MISVTDDSEVPQFIRPSQRFTQFGLMLRHFELLRPSGAACLSRLLQHTVRLVHRRSVILFLSDLLEPSQEIEIGFKQLRFHGHEVIVLQTLDQDELEIPICRTAYLRRFGNRRPPRRGSRPGSAKIPRTLQRFYGTASAPLPGLGNPALRRAHRSEPMERSGFISCPSVNVSSEQPWASHFLIRGFGSAPSPIGRARYGIL
jgi:hypothetical protein